MPLQRHGTQRRFGARPIVLSVCDSNLLASALRNAVLARAGYAVIPVSREEQAICYLAQHEIDLVIVGHKFPSAETRRLLRRLRATKNVPVLTVYAEGPDPRIKSDEQVGALDGPEQLLAAASALIQHRHDPRSVAACNVACC